MMNGFRLVVALGLTVLLLVSGSVMMGRAMPAREVSALAAYGFSVCAGRPCFAGVVPGVTTKNDPALQRLYWRRSNHSGPCQMDHIICNVFYFPVVENVDGSFVASAAFTALALESDRNVSYFRVDELIRLYGDPCGIDVNWDSLEYRLMLPFVRTHGVLDADRRVNLSSKIGWIQLDESNPCEHGALPWYGFASVERYRNFFVGQRGAMP